MKTTLHYYVMKYYLTQWTDNRIPDKQGTDNRGSSVSAGNFVIHDITNAMPTLMAISIFSPILNERDNQF